MNFGPLQIVTAWRLTKAGVMCQGIVMDGPEGVRLVVIEGQQIVEWTRFGRVFDLRQHVRKAFKARNRDGWVMNPNIPSHSPRPNDAVPGLLSIAEQALD